MRHLWQWFCGYVCISLYGRQINRFLNLCSRNGIRLWKITRDIEHVIRVHIGLKDFYYLKPYLRKTKTRMKIVSKKGFPFWCYRHPKLKWMLVAVVFAGCMFLYSFNYIWEIEIHGNEKVSTYELMEFLENQKIETGVKKDVVDCSALEYQLRQKFQDLGWVSVYMNHTKLCIEIKESLYDAFEFVPEEENIQYNLVAEKDAVIYSIITRKGDALVKNGQFVKKGDILVLGQSEIYDDSGAVREVLHFEADAQVYADVQSRILISLSEMELLSLKLAGNASDEMLLLAAHQKINKFLEKMQENGVIILDKNVMIDKKEKYIVFICDITTREQIGIKIPVEEQIEYEFE